jgi:SAM-dependent methyltransferase
MIDAGGERWPVIDDVVFARASRRDLARTALALLDNGSRHEALILLLADQDDWWTGPTADPAALRQLVEAQDSLSLRQAMQLLSWGPVADYFAHRWSDPTFVAGIALMEAHWDKPRTAFELACGIGHYLRVLASRGVVATGADVVFAKLWVARHWIAPAAELICLDAALHPWPTMADRRFDLVACHDAFYFLEPKDVIVAQLRRMSEDGVLVIGHVHNREWPNLSAGAALTASELRAMLPDALIYDDAELTRTAQRRDIPKPSPPQDLREVEAFSVALGRKVGRPGAANGHLALPLPGTRLRRNPLYQNGAVVWPSDRYEREYGPRATYPAATTCPAEAVASEATVQLVLSREMLDLPDRW